MSPSPTKARNQTLRCAVLTKSPLKPTKTGNMFTLTLSDHTPSSTIRALCFQGDEMFDNFKPLTTYDISNFKVKKSFYGQNDMEILIDTETELKESSIQYNMEKSAFNIRQIICGEAQNIRYINLKAKVMAIEDIATVGKYPNQRKKRDIFLADSTGQINLVLWQERAKEIPFSVKSVIQINNAVVSSFNNRYYVTTSMETSIETIQEVIEVDDALVHQDTEKPHTITQSESRIDAYKEFTTSTRCINCRTVIYATQQSSTMQEIILKCTACSTVFRAQKASVVNECKFLIGEHWFSAKSTVSNRIFILINCFIYFNFTDTFIVRLLESKPQTYAQFS